MQLFELIVKGEVTSAHVSIKQRAAHWYNTGAEAVGDNLQLDLWQNQAAFRIEGSELSSAERCKML